HDLERLGLHLAVAEKGVLRILGELFHPIAQLRRVNVQVLRCLNIGHASILDQAYSLKLELSRKLPSLHDPPPAPSKHLTRCLRNRVQANATFPPREPSSEWRPSAALVSGASSDEAVSRSCARTARALKMISSASAIVRDSKQSSCLPCSSAIRLASWSVSLTSAGSTSTLDKRP